MKRKSKKKKLRLRFKYFMFLKMIFISYFLSILFMSLTEINFWKNDNDKIIKIEQEIQELVEIEEIPVTEEETDTLINVPEDKEDIYWQYKDVSLINVDI